MTTSLAMTLAGRGMVSPLGLDTASSLAAIRAGISALGELPYAEDSGAALIGAAIPNAIFHARFADRLLGFLTEAVRQALVDGEVSDPCTVPILLALPENDRPGVPRGFSQHILSALAHRLKIHVLDERSQTYPLGHAAAFTALGDARRLLASGETEACLVCAVDSLIRARTLLWLDEAGRLKIEREPVGVYPGEAAAAVLMVPGGMDGQPNSLSVLGLGYGLESVGPLDEAPLRGEGLAAALRQALAEAGLGMHEIDVRLSDVTGEPYGFMEHTLALARMMREVRDSLPLWHLVDLIGDTGAAAGLCQLLIAAHAFARGLTPGPRAACFTSSFSGKRAVAIVAAQT